MERGKMISARREIRDTYTFAIHKARTLRSSYKVKNSLNSDTRKPRNEKGTKGLCREQISSSLASPSTTIQRIAVRFAGFQHRDPVPLSCKEDLSYPL